MLDDGSPLIRQQLRTPRVAAYAGIVFSLLLGTTMVLIQTSIPLATPYDSSWLDERAGRVELAVALTPFAGIAFRWFMGVIRDRIGHQEDKLFSTVFVGSGVLFLGGLFIWVTIIGALLASAEADPESLRAGSAFLFGMSMVDIFGGVVTLRMAGVFMFSTGTIWRRTRAMPGWLVWVTWIVAALLLVGGSSIRLLRMAFPAWVLMVSLLILRVEGRLAEG
ncbi:MAG: hypothetical protein ACR2QE_20090 [Acidimicrobiales bacterium]